MTRGTHLSCTIPDRRIAMHLFLAEELARSRARERQLEASVVSRAARLRKARRWQRWAEQATYRANLARLAIR